jgi:excisionase family DNA binding protein
MKHQSEKLLRQKEAAKLLGIPSEVPRRMAVRGETPAFKVGKFWIYRVRVDGSKSGHGTAL